MYPLTCGCGPDQALTDKLTVPTRVSTVSASEHQQIKSYGQRSLHFNQADVMIQPAHVPTYQGMQTGCPAQLIQPEPSRATAPPSNNCGRMS
jgi:hypothetical protein